MLKQHSELFKGMMIGSDLVFISIAWWSAFLLRFPSGFMGQSQAFVFRHYLIAWFVVLFVWAAVFQLFQFYRPRRISTHRRELADLVRASIAALLVFLGLLFLIREIVLSRLVVALFWLLSIALLDLSHIVFREGLRLLRRRGYNLRQVLIIGAPNQIVMLAQRLISYRHLGLRIFAVYFTELSDAVGSLERTKILTNRDEVIRAIQEGVVDQIFVTLPLEQTSKLKEIQEWIGDEPVALHYVPDLGAMAMLQGHIEEFDGLQVISLQSSPLYGWNALLKRSVDIAIGSVALVVCAPLIVLIAIVIKLTSPGPVFYRQERMGLDGNRFEMLKFRTMVANAEQETGPVWAQTNDPRVTRIGRWLRLFSLDELPQLINVLRGEMSLVGPRPERPPLVDEFRRSIPKYMLRHKVKAGMTGWAQVHGWRGNTSLATRVKYDLEYIENWSLLRDLQILWLTLAGGFRDQGRGRS